MTTRRDLDTPAPSSPTSGGDGRTPRSRALRHEPSFAESTAAREAEKARVGRAAAALVRPGDTLLIDVGTTCLQLARHLHGREGLTVVTNNLAVYEELVDDEAIDILLLGGMVRRNYRSLVGFLTEDSLRVIRADRCFLGISGIAADGTLLDSTVEEIPAKRAMVRASEHVVLLADGAKFAGSGLGRVAGVDVVHTLVTTPDAPADRLDALREAGVDVRLAS